MLRIRKLSRTNIVMLAVAGLLGTSLAFAALEDEIRARLQPAGDICVVGMDCAQGLAVAGATAGAARDPETVYQTFCFACHGTGANNAPVMGNAEHWAPRLEKGIDVLYQHAVEGFNNGLMPPKGLCMDCTAEEVHASVDYMLEALQ